MIILRNLSFPQMAQFYLDNVCSLSGIRFDQDASHPNDRELQEGLLDFQGLLKEIYADWRYFDTGNPKSDYAALVNTVRFLYGCFSTGSLRMVDKAELSLSKDELRKVYKGSSAVRRIETLSRYGIMFRFEREGEPVNTFRQATDLLLSSERGPHLIPALKDFTDQANRNLYSRNGVIYNEFGAFLKGDYGVVSGQFPAEREPFDPLRPDILRTVGSFENEWHDFVNVLSNRAGFSCSGFLHFGFSPSWSVSFFEMGQRPLAIFTLGSETIFIEFTLPLAHAEAMIRNRHRYAPSIREKIESFDCVNCPKECGESEMLLVDGIKLCTGRAEARRIYTVLSEPDEFASIHEMLKISTEMTS